MDMFSSLFNDENLATDQHHVPEQEMLNVNGNEENNKQRKRQSDVWNEMTKYKRKDTEEKDWEEKKRNLRKHEDRKDIEVLAECNYCLKVFDGSSKKGTKHLSNHLERCRKKRKGGEDAQKSIRTSDLTSTDVIKATSLRDWIKNFFDEKGYPTKDLNPSFNSRKVDILEAYQEEKGKLRKIFSQLSCRISLRIERFYRWSVVTARYVDENWKQNTKLISVQDNNYGLRSLIEFVKDLCLDLKINGNICSLVVVDYNYYDDDDVDDDDEINRWFTQQGSLPFVGFRVLDENDFEDDALFWDSSDRITHCTAYVHRTPSNQSNFQIAVNKVKSMGKNIASEPLPRAVSLREGFEMALRYKEAFCELEWIDPYFKSINLTKEQWDEATAVLELHKSIDNVLSLFESNSTTPNMYFPKFCDLHMKLLQAERSVGYLLGKNNSVLQAETLASVKQNFIDKYWSKYNLVLVITVILDPRFKMEIVQLWYNMIYGCDADHCLKEIIDDFQHVYNEYAKGLETSSISYLDGMGRPCSSSHNVISPKSELDRYLKEPKFPSVENFDILTWWCLHSSIFPTLARMAGDFLAVPMSNNDFADCSYRWIANWFTYEELDDDLERAFSYIFILYKFSRNC